MSHEDLRSESRDQLSMLAARQTGNRGVEDYNVGAVYRWNAHELCVPAALGLGNAAFGGDEAAPGDSGKRRPAASNSFLTSCLPDAAEAQWRPANQRTNRSSVPSASNPKEPYA